jgi:hypothetical protein
MKTNFSMFTQYGQFYIADPKSEADAGHPDLWSNEAFKDRLAIADGIMGILIENDEAIANGQIVVHESQIGEMDFSQFDHVVEGSLLIRSGTLQVLDCPNFQAEVTMQLKPGWYRIRISCANFAKAYQKNPEDRYLIDIWNEPSSDKKVVKRGHRS